MKQGIRIFLLVLSVCVVSTALAKQPECVGPKDPPGHGNKPTKVTILHCGCADEGDLMQYVEIQISSKSKGHFHHVAGSISSCFDGVDTYRDFVRSGSDCQVDDGTGSLDAWEPCGERTALQECGTEVIDP